MRKAIQLVLMIALLLSGDALPGAMMPCCAQVPVAASMPATTPQAVKCHDDAMSAAPQTMGMHAEAMLRCPRGTSSLQAGVEWTSGEQADVHSPMQMVARLPMAAKTLTNAREDFRFARLAVPPQTAAFSSLPLRV